MAFISEIGKTHTHTFFLRVVNIYTENKIISFDSFMKNHRNHKKILYTISLVQNIIIKKQ